MNYWQHNLSIWTLIRSLDTAICEMSLGLEAPELKGVDSPISSGLTYLANALGLILSACLNLETLFFVLFYFFPPHFLK